jgi:alanine dehydrogenase
MNIGILRGFKNSEHRVMLIPEAVQELVSLGHNIFIENGAGEASNFNDAEYESAGAVILPYSEKIFQNAELILKVDAPVPVEYELYKYNHICFSFLYLPNNPERLAALVKCNSIFFAAEIIKKEPDVYPILNAMNEIAGIIAFNRGTIYLEKAEGGKGILLSGVDNILPAQITIIGADITGRSVAKQALLNGAFVNIMDYNYEKLEYFLKNNLSPHLKIYKYSHKILRELLVNTDILIGTALKPGERAPIVVSNDDLKLLKPGSVVIDLSIDQGGCIKASRPTKLDKPVFLHNGIIHYCVTNITSAVPNTSSKVLSKVVLPYIKQITNVGFKEAITTNPELRSGLILYHGKVVNPLLAKSHGFEYYDILEFIELNI